MRRETYTKFLAVAIASATTVGMVGVPGNENVNVKAEEVTTTANETTTKSEQTTTSDATNNKNIITGKCGNEVKYAYDEKTKEVRVTGKGEMWDGMYIQDIEDANKVIIEDGVTSIGGYNFLECHNEIKLEIPASVKEIHSDAFRDVTKVVFNTTMKEVHPYAFRYVDTVEFKADVVGFDDHSIYANKAIIHGEAQDLAKATFGSYSCDYVIADDNNKVNIKSKMLISADEKVVYSLAERESKDQMIIPDTVVKIQPYAFSNVDINEIKFGANVEEIGANAFYNCNINKLTLNKKIKSIGDLAFAYNQFKNVTVYTGTKFGDNVFDTKVTLKYTGKLKKMKTLLNSNINNGTVKANFNKISDVKNYEITIKQGKKTVKYKTTKNNYKFKIPASFKSGNFKVSVRGYKTVKNKKVYTKSSNTVILEKE
ncbi:MAG: leucine-rich repeat domain-containing protein [Lachnospiraceae bacterium]|nr:leucine-rich repeat domain-containing protein [Lachnospiraceae bacterium]